MIEMNIFGQLIWIELIIWSQAAYMDFTGTASPHSHTVGDGDGTFGVDLQYGNEHKEEKVD